MTSENYKLSSMNAKETTHSSIISFSWTRTILCEMCFRAMQASKANTKVAQK
jgi:hypothetical protein